MEHYNKIIELLDKKNLTPEEKIELKTLQREEQNAAFIAGYLQIRSALRKSHISLDEMADYILYKNGLEPKNKIPSFRFPAIEAHLKECKSCSIQLAELKDEYSEIERHVDQHLNVTVKDVKPADAFTRTRTYYKPVYAFASIIILGVMYLAMYAVSGVVTPDHYKYAAITNDAEVYLTRGRATTEFLQSFEALESEDYETAISFLKKDIGNNPSDETIFYSHYVMGLAYLEMSENRFLGLFPSYDETEVKQGIASLNTSVELNNSGKFNNIKLDALFYLAKGNLMLGNKENAREYLQQVVAGKGSRMNDAAQILNELE